MTFSLNSPLVGACLFCILACGAAQAPTTERETDEVRTSTDDPRPFVRHGFAGSAAVVFPDGTERCFGNCSARYSPASTFKVPHALIALEAGVLSGPEHSFAWDGQERSFPAWNHDHTLATAIEYSVVWYFQRVAPLVGRARFETDLPHFRYGDANVGDDLTQFWLDDSLTVSPIEQARFWRRLHSGDLPVSEGSRAAVLEMTVLAREGDSVLRGKTGWHASAPVGGWFVGSLETAGDVVTFAVRLSASEGYDTAAFLAARRAVAEELLAELGFVVPRPR